MTRTPTTSQRRALQFVAQHGENGEAESWCDFEKAHWSASQLRFAGLSHDRTFESLRRHGWIKDGEITEAGRAVLEASDNDEVF